MKLGIDVSELEGTPGGVGRCLRNWYRNWVAAGSTDEFHCYHRGSRPVVEASPRITDRTVSPTLDSPRFLWEQIDLPRAARRDRLDVLFCPGYSMPVVLPCRGVVAIHDLSFKSHPEWFGWRERNRRRFLCSIAARHASLIITGSSFSASEILCHYHVPEERLLVVPYGVDPVFRKIDDAAQLEQARWRFGLKGDFVLWVGALFSRRHIPVLLDAFAMAGRCREDLSLVVVGKNLTLPRVDFRGLTRLLGMEDRVHFIETIEDADLLLLYNLASVFVFMSEYEGFGLTPLEALACGAPVIASRNTALKENLEGWARLIERNDAERLTAEIMLLLEHPELGRLDKKGVEELRRRYNWETSSAALLDAMHRLAGRG